jgi:hypothetical protein
MMTMPARSFPEVPQLTRPTYRDMDGQLASARQQWARMRENTLSQPPAPAPMIRQPFTPPAPAGPQQHREMPAVETGLLWALAARLVSELIRHWRASRPQRPL